MTTDQTIEITDEQDFRHPANGQFLDDLRKTTRFSLRELRSSGHGVSFNEEDANVGFVLEMGDGTSVMSTGIERDPQLSVQFEDGYVVNVDLDEEIVPNVGIRPAGKFGVAQALAEDPMGIAEIAIAEARRMRERGED